jgi:hypothetical protein
VIENFRYLSEGRYPTIWATGLCKYALTLVFSSNRPLGVRSMMLGGRNGYSAGSRIRKWYRPPSKSVPAGPRRVQCHSCDPSPSIMGIGYVAAIEAMGENTHKNVVLTEARGGCRVSVRMKYRGGVIRQTSSGAAEYSVLGSFASSRASCMMRLTAGGSYEKTRRDKSAKTERRRMISRGQDRSHQHYSC